MRTPHGRHHAFLPDVWLWLLALALSTSGILLGIRTDDYHLVNRSAGVLLLVIALACVRDILG
jgi:hypothetical protein